MIRAADRAAVIALSCCLLVLFQHNSYNFVQITEIVIKQLGFLTSQILLKGIQ